MTRRTIIKGGNLLDMVSGKVVENSIIIIENEHITHVSPFQHLEVSSISEQDKVIDGSGKWLIPGLIDMHVHIKEGFAPYFVAAGVTTVRNTGGNVLELQKLREAPTDAPTPRVISADRIIDGPPGLWGETSPWSLVTNDPLEARKEVQRQIESGADFIKVYGLLSKEVMKAVIDEAKANNKEVSADLIYQTQVNALEAAELGIDWIEHASGFLQVLYPDWSMKAEEEIWKQINWEQPSSPRLEELCLALIAKGVKLCPTIVVYDQIQKYPDYWYPEHLITRSLEGGGMVQQWEMLANSIDSFRRLGIQSQIIQWITKTYFDLGGTVVAGTDTPAGLWTIPGLALHRELEIFVESGFSELEALQAATCHAAKALNRHDLGVIREGAVADLLVLNANPLERIQHTRDIEYVLKGGELYKPEDFPKFIPTEEEIKKAYDTFVKKFQSSV